MRGGPWLSPSYHPSGTTFSALRRSGARAAEGNVDIDEEDEDEDEEDDADDAESKEEIAADDDDDDDDLT